jgi:hypothetical protein
MKVFISWSGEKSKKIGEAIRTWLPAVLQSVKPFFTPSDIEKGNRWSTDIASELDSSSVGIFCITRENINSPWIMFEAGAISKKVDQSLVCPILFGLKNSDVAGPLTQFQMTLFDRHEMKSLIRTINSSNKDTQIAEEVLNEVFDVWWPKLESKVNAILNQDDVEPVEKLRGEREILEEILDLSRSLAKVQGLDSTPKNQAKFYGLVSEFLMNFSLVFDVDWEHTRLSLGDNIPDFVISKSGTFISPRVRDEANNWSSRGALLHSYRELISFIRNNQIDIPVERW